MKRPTNGSGITVLLRRETRAALKLSPWVLGSLLLAALLWHTDLAATGGLFQSAQPTPTSIPSLTPTPTQEALPSPTATPQAPSSPTATTPEVQTTPTAEFPAVTFTATPSSGLTATPVPTNVPSPTATPTETPILPTSTPVPPTVTPVPAQAEPDEGQRYAEGDSNLLFDWSVLIDSMALGLSYVWLCCGVLVVLALPILFAILWVRSRRSQSGEE